MLLLNDSLFPKLYFKDSAVMDDLKVSSDRLVEGHFNVFRLGLRKERTEREELGFLTKRLQIFPLRSILDRTLIFEQESLGYRNLERVEWRPYDRLEPYGYGLLSVLTELPRPVLARLFRGTPTVVSNFQYPAAWRRMVEEIRVGRLRIGTDGGPPEPPAENLINKLGAPVVFHWESHGTRVALHNDEQGHEIFSHVIDGRKPLGLERDPQLGPHPLYEEELGKNPVWGTYRWGTLRVQLLQRIFAEDMITYYDFPTKQPK